MLTTELHEATVAFARALRSAPAVTAYHAAAAALDADPAAPALLDELRARQAAVQGHQFAGATPQSVDVEGLRAAQAAVRANERIIASMRATNEVKAFLPKVGATVTAALGADYGRLVAPTSC